MRSKILIGIIIILGLSIYVHPQPTDENTALEEMKAALKNIIRNPVQQLGKTNSRDGIKQKLIDIEKEFNARCAKIDKDWKEKISGDLGNFIKGLEAVKDKDLKQKSTEFSKTLTQTFKDLVNAIETKIQENKKKAEEAEKEAILKKIRESISANATRTASVIKQVKKVLVLAVVILILAVISLCFLYFMLFKRIKAVENFLHNPANSMLGNINSYINRSASDLGKKIENGFITLKTTGDENAGKIILLIKDNDTEILNRLSRQESPGPTGEPQDYEPQPTRIEIKKKWKTAPLESEGDNRYEPGTDKSLIIVDFPGDITGNQWKDDIIESFKVNKPFIIRWIEKNEKNGEVVKKWIENIGRAIRESTGDNEESFFDKIYPDIKTTRSQLSKIEFETFRPYFFDPLLKALRIEEFGRPEERYEPGKHHPIGGTPGAGNLLIKKLNFPGYKVKYSDRVLVKAQVEL